MGSVWVLVHLLPHAVLPDGQLLTQVPAEHDCPDAQVVPQAPQLLGSFCVFTQDPAHEV
jgi:hypothetical protein